MQDHRDSIKNGRHRIMTLAQLKRDAKSGTLKAEMVYRFGEDIPERLQGVRDIVGANSVAIFFRNADGRKSELQIKRASLVEYSGDKLTTYRAGKRELNAKEKAVMDAWHEVTETQRYKDQAYADAMTDGSSTYYQEKAFFESRGFGYLRGFDYEHGCKYDWNTGKVIDESIKGEVEIEYKIIRGAA